MPVGWAGAQLCLSHPCIFWLRCEGCGILVSRTGIQRGPSTVRVPSPNHWREGQEISSPILE